MCNYWCQMATTFPKGHKDTLASLEFRNVHTSVEEKNPVAAFIANLFLPCHFSEGVKEKRRRGVAWREVGDPAVKSH